MYNKKLTRKSEMIKLRAFHSFNNWMRQSCTRAFARFMRTGIDRPIHHKFVF